MMVSIIVTCYNQGQYLAECLDSVVNQTYREWECVVMNDGSTDDTATVAQRFAKSDGRIKYYYQENQGVVAARNNAIRLSHGEYILPLDGDDKIAPDYLESAVPILENDRRVQLVYCNVELFGTKTGPMVLWDVNLRNILSGGCCVNSSVYRREAFDAIGGYKEEMSKGLEDWEFFMSLVERGGTFRKIDKVLFYYRMLPKSRNVKYEDPAYNELNCQVVRLHPDLYHQQYRELLWEYNSIVLSRKYKLMKILFKPYEWVRRLFYRK